jgi:hypothetical protein
LPFIGKSNGASADRHLFAKNNRLCRSQPESHDVRSLIAQLRPVDFDEADIVRACV